MSSGREEGPLQMALPRRHLARHAHRRRRPRARPRPSARHPDLRRAVERRPAGGGLRRDAAAAARAPLAGYYRPPVAGPQARTATGSTGLGPVPPVHSSLVKSDRIQVFVFL